MIDDKKLEKICWQIQNEIFAGKNIRSIRILDGWGWYSDLPAVLKFGKFPEYLMLIRDNPKPEPDVWRAVFCLDAADAIKQFEFRFIKHDFYRFQPTLMLKLHLSSENPWHEKIFEFSNEHSKYMFTLQFLQHNCGMGCPGFVGMTTHLIMNEMRFAIGRADQNSDGFEPGDYFYINGRIDGIVENISNRNIFHPFIIQQQKRKIT